MCFWSLFLVRYQHTKNWLYMFWGKLAVNLVKLFLIKKGMVWPSFAHGYFGKFLCFWSLLLLRSYHTKNWPYILWSKFAVNLVKLFWVKSEWSDHLLPAYILVIWSLLLVRHYHIKNWPCTLWGKTNVKLGINITIWPQFRYWIFGQFLKF